MVVWELRVEGEIGGGRGGEVGLREVYIIGTTRT